MSLQRRLIAADGYCDLGMVDEAFRELSKLEPAEQKLQAVMEMKLKIAMDFRRWDLGLAACAALRTAFPDDSQGYVHGAFCLHELGRTADARTLLLSGPLVLLQDPTYYYNLGCYDAVLGNYEEARNNLSTSFSMQKGFRECAKTDRDLKALREWLNEES